MTVLARLPVTRRLDPSMLGDAGFERVEGDRYWTEPWVTKALLDRVRLRGGVWEPACGRGDMIAVLADYGYRLVASDIAGATLGCDRAVAADFLACRSLPPGVRSIVTNPPYALAMHSPRNFCAWLSI
jgi:hypothetical protein